jgi:hypothetical protein
VSSRHLQGREVWADLTLSQRLSMCPICLWNPSSRASLTLGRTWILSTVTRRNAHI